MLEGIDSSRFASPGWSSLPHSGDGSLVSIAIQPAADRRRSRHHQRPGADQHRGVRAIRRWRSSSASPSRSRRMGGCPRSNTRARSRATACRQVTVVFEDGTDIYFARQLVNERIQQVQDQLPPGLEPTMGPIATGLGEIFMWTVEAEPGARKARTARRTRRPTCGRSRTGSSGRSCATSPVSPTSTPSAVSSKQFHVTAGSREADGLRAQLPRRDEALARQQRQRRRRLHRAQRASSIWSASPGQVADIEDIERHRRRRSATACRSASRDVADVRMGKELRTGAATAERRGSRARHGLHADRREQPHGVPARRRQAGGGQPHAAAGRRRARPSTTAPRWSTRRSPPCEKNLLEGALLVIVVLFLLARQPPRRAHHRARHSALDAVHHHRHGRRQVSAAT